ncbi:hypothetical protein BGX26_006946 [Mortierella sp. AD094]|nr:hypothetical protein BGX26_006946 [Mortierella sp. AD094]
MSDALDDWEQADERDIEAPVVVAKVAKKVTTVATIPPRATPSPPVPIGVTKGATPTILRMNTDRRSEADQENLLRREDNVDDNDRSLHERNRALWDKANSYEQPVISRSDNNNMRTEYVPEIKILRRPKSPVQTVKVSHTKSKPLAQREADYNAAREKIFGPTSVSGSGSGNNNNNNEATSRPNSRSSSTSLSGSSSPSPSAPQTGPKPGPGSSVHPNQRHTSVRSEVKPIEFRGSPPSIKLAQRPPAGASGGTQDGNTIIRQPQGPSMSPQASSQTRGARQERQDGSIGFQRPFRGAPPRPPAPSS